MHFFQDIQLQQLLIKQQMAIEQVAQTGQALCLFCQLKTVVTAGLAIADVRGELIDPQSKIPVERVYRGGRLTIHGPGQLVCFPIIPLRLWQFTLQDLITFIEKWIRLWLRCQGVRSHTRPGLTGIWAVHPQTRKEAKLGSIGVAARRAISQHGFSINIFRNPELENRIIPCGNALDPMINLDQLVGLDGIKITQRQRVDSYLEKAASQLQFIFDRLASKYL